MKQEECFTQSENQEASQPELKRGWHMFYLLPIAYVIAPYFFCAVLMLAGEEGNDYLSVLMALPVVLGIANIVVSVTCCKQENRLLFLNSAVLIKYALIPLYLMGGFLVLIAILFSFIPVPFMIFAGPMMAFLLVGIGWIILAMGSPYVIAYLRLSRKAGIRPLVTVVIHSLLQFFFTVDVIDVMFLAIRERKWIKTTISLILGFLIAVIAFVIWIINVMAGM